MNDKHIHDVERLKSSPAFRKQRNPPGSSWNQNRSIYNIFIELSLIFLIVFTPVAYGAVESWGIAVLEITAAFIFMIWFMMMIRNGIFEFIRVPFLLLVFLFILYVLSQLAFSHFSSFSDISWLPGTIYSWATGTELLKIIAYAIIFLCVLNTVKTKAGIIRILSVIITMGFIMSIFYLMRYFGGTAPGGIINPDHFAGYLGMIIPIMIGFLLSPSDERTGYSVYAKKILFFYIIAIMGGALFFTMSRGGMLSFIAALLVMAVLTILKKSGHKSGRAKTLSVITIFIVLTIVWFGATPIIERLFSIKAEIASLYFGGRLPLWQETFGIIKDYPIFGTGLGTFNSIFPKYQSIQNATMHFSHAHGDYIELLSDTGIVGFLLMISWLSLIIAYMLKRLKKRRDPWIVGMSIGLFGSLTSIFVHSLSDFNLHIPGNALILIIILALSLVVLHFKEGKTGERLLIPKKIITYPPISFKTDNKQKILQRVMNVSSYLVILAVVIFYVRITLYPALANYYFKKADPGLTSQMNIVMMSNIQDTLKAIEFDPGNADYHYHLGKLYYRKYVRASKLKMHTAYLYAVYTISEYKKAIELNPVNRKHHQSLAWVYGQFADLAVSSGDKYLIPDEDYLGNAIREFETAIHLEPNNPFGHRAYAIWLLHQSTKFNFEKGLSEYRKAIALRPEIIIEAIRQYQKAAKKSFSFERLLPANANLKLYLALAGELKDHGFTKESGLVLNLAAKKSGAPREKIEELMEKKNIL